MKKPIPKRSSEALDRKRKADAELAELNVAERRGNLVRREDVLSVWRDGFAKLAALIRNATYLDDEQRKRLSAEFIAVKLEELL